MKFLFFVVLLFCPFFVNGKDADDDKTENTKKEKEEKKEDEPPHIGNFSLRTSQQPGPLVGEAENIVDEGQVQLFLFADLLRGNKSYRSDVIGSFLYGIRDDLSIYLSFPYAPKNRERQNTSSGWEDFFVQLEYVYYTKKTTKYEDQATIAGNIAFPTGSALKNPPTGFGSPSFFLATTYNRTELYWFYFGLLGGILTTSHNGTQFGNQLLYQLGIGKTFWTPPGWIVAWMLEFNGFTIGRNRIKGTTDPNSGGNLILVTPSLWVSNNNWIIQLGAGPAFARFNGDQPRPHYQLISILAWTF